MLEEINKLKLFFEDCYREISVREYSREMKISPPTASKILKEFYKQECLNMREERGFLLFRANRDSLILKGLSRVYWNLRLKELIAYLESFFPKAIVLFGSLSKLEAKKDSDIDILLISPKKEVNTAHFEKKLNRKIQIFSCDSIDKIGKELRLNIINGYILRGYLS